MKRVDGRKMDQLRPVKFRLGYVDYPEGSVLICTGKTRVLCNVTVQEGVPAWLDRPDSTTGWITAEYALLPRSTTTRVDRETRGLRGRTQEIKRMIGRSLRAGFNLELLGKRTLIVDCDVLQADGGTRTASITGGYLALLLALQRLEKSGEISKDVYRPPVGAISVGVIDGEIVLDLNYHEDSRADVDLNVVMNGDGEYIELQGTGEGDSFSPEQLQVMLDTARKGIDQLLEMQESALRSK